MDGFVVRAKPCLAGGVDSIAAAWSLTEQAVDICQKTTPEVIWATFEPKL